MISEKYDYAYNPKPVSESGLPTEEGRGYQARPMQNPGSEKEQREAMENEMEIQREMEKLRKRDEEEDLKKQENVRRRIDQHLNQHGGDLSRLLSQHVPNEIKCVKLSNYGSNKNIRVAECELPLPMKHEVLIRSAACGVNFHDVLERQGILDHWVRSLKLPFTMGSEVAGEVVGLGKDVTDFKLGDRILALPERKAWSEYVVCRSEHCFLLPDDMTFQEAIALISDGMTAYSLLFELGALRPGQAVLTHPLPGGLNAVLTQMVRTVPDVRMFKIAGNKENVEGEKIVYCIEHDTDYVAEIRHASPQGVDLILDCQYQDNFSRDFNLLRPLGKYILFGTEGAADRGFFDVARSWWGQEKISLLKLYEENKCVCGFNLRNLLYFQKDKFYIRNLYNKVCSMWQEGFIQPVYDSILSINDFSEALHRMQEHAQHGKVILNPVTLTEAKGPERDYYSMAKDIVEQRNKQQRSFLNKLRLPEPGELVSDEEPAKERKQREQPELEQLQRSLLPTGTETKGSMYPTLPTKPEAVLTTEKVELHPTTQLNPEPPIVLDPSTGRTVIRTTETVPQQPSPYSVEKVLEDLPKTEKVIEATKEILPKTENVIETPTEVLPTTENVIETLKEPTAPPAEATQTDVKAMPVLTKEKVEVNLPLAAKLEEQLPEGLQDIGGEKPQTFIEKLRETFSTSRNE